MGAVPAIEFGATLWDVLMEAGAPHGLVPAGYRAIDSLRLEKGYRAWGSDVTGDDTPLEAGLAFAVAFDKPTAFTGRDALEEARRMASARLSCLTLADPRSMTLGNEPVYRDGRVVSRVTSGGVGYTLGKSIAYAYLPTELGEPGTRLRVDVFGELVDATVVPAPLFDPKGERIRA